jgi:hypothetical protein
LLENVEDSEALGSELKQEHIINAICVKDYMRDLLYNPNVMYLTYSLLLNFVNDKLNDDKYRHIKRNLLECTSFLQQF